MSKLITEFRGFSGSRVLLMADGAELFVRKIGGVDRNFERMTHLIKKGYLLPQVYEKFPEMMDMQYIPGLGMLDYLPRHGPGALAAFIEKVINGLALSTSGFRDYTPVYRQKLREYDFSHLGFTAEQLLMRLPKTLPQSDYVGDLTLENIIFGDDNQFYIIDPSTVEYDSWVFDLAKLRQDLHCGWIARQGDYQGFRNCLADMENALLDRFAEARFDSLLILMLLRVHRHSKPESLERSFLEQEIIRLWK